MRGHSRSVSLNEVESLAAKAARGAGAGWGVADDIARATRWMAERDLDWCTPLLGLLHSPRLADQLGPAFHAADRLSAARPGARWRLESCEPVWAVAILSAAFYGRGVTLELAWDGCTARLQTDGALSLEGTVAGLERLEPRAMEIAVAAPKPPLPNIIPATARRSVVSSASWQALEGYATRTYVPASPQSRASGAGGGRVDAD